MVLPNYSTTKELY